MAEVVVPLVILQGIGLVIWAVAAFLLGRWYQRRRSEGMEKPAIIDLAKQTALAEANKEYDSLIAKAKEVAAKINSLKG